MTDKLGLFNGALRLLGERKLASLVEAREPRRVLDDIWDEGAVKYCLSQGLWNFASRSGQYTYSPSYTPEFGLAFAFEKPEDWVRTSAVCSDEYFKVPLLNYSDEGGLWFADIDTLYIRYVSNDASFGGDLALWPLNFAKYVQSYLAFEAAPKISGSASKVADIEKAMRHRLTQARSSDAMDEPTKFPARSSWLLSRGQFRHVRGSGIY